MYKDYNMTHIIRMWWLFKMST